MKDAKLIIAIITCVITISGLLVGCVVMLASVNNSTDALKEVKVVISEHTTAMANLKQELALNTQNDGHVKDDVSELKQAVNLLATLNSNLEKLLKKDG